MSIQQQAFGLAPLLAVWKSWQLTLHAHSACYEVTGSGTDIRMLNWMLYSHEIEVREHDD